MLKELVEVEFLSDYTIEEVSEGEGKPKRFKFEAVVQRADVKNGNGRVYPRKILERELGKFTKKITEKTSLGEIDHPLDGRSTIENTGILWETAGMDASGVVKAKGLVLDTAKGRDLKAIMAAGGRIGISSRGRGTTRRDSFKGEQVDMVTEDFDLVTFDAVVGQSVADAYVTSAFLEQTKEEDTGMKLTLESLEKEHPEVYKDLRSKMEESLRSEFEQTLTAKLDEKIAALENSIKEDAAPQIEALVTESVIKERAKVEAVIATVIDVLAEAGYVGDDGDEDDDRAPARTSNDPAAHQKIESLQATVASLTEQLQKTAQRTEENAKVLNEAQLESYLETSLTGNPFAKDIREALEDRTFSTLEEVGQAIEKETNRLRNITKRATSMPIPRPSSQPLHESDNGGSGLTAEQQRQRRIAGL